MAKKKQLQHPVPSHLKRFYVRRYDLFSRYDEGVVLKGDQWFSVTPEKVARQVALSCKQLYPNADTVIDAMGGAGGNVIQFASLNHFSTVLYLDISAEYKNMAEINASVYGVSDRIQFHVTDFFNYKRNGIDNKVVLFLSPPWGGPEYGNVKTWDITTASPSIVDIMNHGRSITPNIVLFLPKNTNLDQLESLRRPGIGMRIDWLMMKSHPVGICVYYFEDTSLEA